MPEALHGVTFGLVICDGPPAERTLGGRFGLLPLLGSRLAPDCEIVLDDMVREHEQQLVKAWSALLPMDVWLECEQDPYAVLRLMPSP